MNKPGTGHPLAESLRTAAAIGTPLVYLCPRRKRSFLEPYTDFEAKLTEMNGTAWLLLDGAAAHSAVSAISDTATNVLRLFPDDSDPELVRLAPLMVGFDSVSDLLENWPHFWGFGIASVVVSSAPSDALLNHLKSILYVEADGGEVCILRFFDPRVLDRLTEVLDPQQLELLFADIVECFLFEGQDGALQMLEAPELAGSEAS